MCRQPVEDSSVSDYSQLGVDYLLPTDKRSVQTSDPVIPPAHVYRNRIADEQLKSWTGKTVDRLTDHTRPS